MQQNNLEISLKNQNGDEIFLIKDNIITIFASTITVNPVFDK